MRRSNMMKLVSVVMVVAMLMLSATSAFAATVTPGADRKTITVSGTVDVYPTTDLTITLLKPGVTEADVNAWLEGGTPIWDEDKFLAATSLLVDSEDGSYSHTFKLANELEGGIYLAFVGDEVVQFALPEDVLAVFKALVADVVSSSVEARIDENGSLLGIDVGLWNEIESDDADTSKSIASAAIVGALADLRAKGDNITMDDLPEARRAINAESFTQKFSDGQVSELEEAGEYLDVENGLSIAASDDLTEDAKGVAISLLVGDTYSKAQDLEDAYNGLFFVAAVTNPTDGQVSLTRKYLDNMGPEINGLTAMTIYSSLTDLQKQSVATTVMNSTARTVPELNAILSQAVAPYATIIPGVNPGGGNTGGGTGSGGGAGGVGTIVVNTPTPTPTATPIYERYIDIDEYSWAWEAIEALTNNGVVVGYGNGIFNPESPMLREEFVKALVVGLYGEENIDMTAVPSFTDAQNGWYAPYIAAAEAYGITEGIGDGLFGIGQVIKRQDMALMLYRILRDSGLEMVTTPYAFSDAEQIDDYAAEAVYALKNTGIMNGDPEGTIRPQDSTTRAEAAVLIFNVLKQLGKIIY